MRLASSPFCTHVTWSELEAESKSLILVQSWFLCGSNVCVLYHLIYFYDIHVQSGYYYSHTIVKGSKA